MICVLCIMKEYEGYGFLDFEEVYIKKYKICIEEIWRICNEFFLNLCFCFKELRNVILELKGNLELMRNCMKE